MNGRIIRCSDSSAAIKEAFKQKELGNRVSVGREPFDGQWYVRIQEAKATEISREA